MSTGKLGRRFELRLSDEDHQSLWQAAAENGTNASELLRTSIHQTASFFQFRHHLRSEVKDALRVSRALATDLSHLDLALRHSSYSLGNAVWSAMGSSLQLSEQLDERLLKLLQEL